MTHSPDAEPPRHQSVEGVHPQDTTKQASANSPAHFPIQAGIKPTPKVTTQAKHCRPDQTPWAKYALEVIAVAIGLGYTIAAYRQLEAINNQIPELQKSAQAAQDAATTARNTLDEIRKSGIDTHTVADAAQKQAAASERIAAASERSVKAAQDAARKLLDEGIAASRLDQRAWVGVRDAKLVDKVEVGRFVRFYIYVENTGKTPAIDMTTVSDVAGTTPQEPINDLDFASTERTTPHKSTLQPGAVDTIPQSTGSPLTPERYYRIMNGIEELNVFGTIRYNDVFKQPHRTDFCLVFQPERSSFRACDRHNNVD